MAYVGPRRACHGAQLPTAGGAMVAQPQRPLQAPRALVATPHCGVLATQAMRDTPACTAPELFSAVLISVD
jgi:hypothetical protein